MSQPSIPNITPNITLSREDALNLLLASVAMEELGLGHIVNAEAEKIQYSVGTLPGLSIPATISDLLQINTSVQMTLKESIKKEMLLGSKLDSILAAPSLVGPTGPTGPTGATATFSVVSTARRFFYNVPSDVTTPVSIAANQFTDDNNLPVTQFPNLSANSYANLYINGILQLSGIYSVSVSSLQISSVGETIFAGESIILVTVQFTVVSM